MAKSWTVCDMAGPAAQDTIRLWLRPVPPDPEESRGAYGRRLRETAHGLLTEALASCGGTGAFSLGPQGKPYLPGGPQFNLTHCGGLAVCAVGGLECGVDAEPLHRRTSPAAERRVCTGEELSFLEAGGSFLRLWTLKESFVKATGAGLSQGLKEVSFTPAGDGLAFNVPGYMFRQYQTKTHFISLCVRKEGPQTPIRPEGLTVPPTGDFGMEIVF